MGSVEIPQLPLSPDLKISNIIQLSDRDCSESDYIEEGSERFYVNSPRLKLHEKVMSTDNAIAIEKYEEKVYALTDENEYLKNEL